MVWAGLHLMYATRYAHLYYEIDARRDRLQLQGPAGLP